MNRKVSVTVGAILTTFFVGAGIGAVVSMACLSKKHESEMRKMHPSSALIVNKK